MAYMHAVAGRVNTAIDGNRLLFCQVIQALFIRLLVYRTAPLEFVNNIHEITHLSAYDFLLSDLSVMTGSWDSDGSMAYYPILLFLLV